MTAAPRPHFQGLVRGLHRTLSSPAQLLLLAALTLIPCDILIEGETPRMLILAAACGLGFLVASPGAALRLLLLTLSCDQVLTFKVGALTVRLAHVCAGLLFVRLGVERLVAGRPLTLPLRPLQPLAVYLLAAAVGAMGSANLPKSLGYLAWAAFDGLALFTVVHEACRTEAGFRMVVRWWVLGGCVAAAFGVVQLLLGFAHLPVPLVSQMLGDFPRINGFNYEPSYFAFYLEQIAAALLGVWWGAGQRGRTAALLALVLLVPVALSMSRSGWLGIALMLLVAVVALAVRTTPDGLARSGAWAGLLATGALLLLPAAFLSEAPRMAAMAVDTQEASSTAPRLGMMAQAKEIFRRQPLLGVGLGGYGGYLAEHPDLADQAQLADLEHAVTTNVWLEAAAETGVLGVFAVVWWVGSLLVALGRALLRARGFERAWATGLFLSTGLLFGVLYQFSQTLWRLDVWVLLALGWSTVGRIQRQVRA
jgi:O-antigen ligase